MGRFTARTLVILGLVAAAMSADARPSESSVRLPMTPGQPETGSVVVQPGDHLWKISATRLEQGVDRAVTDAEIWPYWRRVIEANVPSLRSGDADLIYPGEVIVLPASD